MPNIEQLKEAVKVASQIESLKARLSSLLGSSESTKRSNHTAHKAKVKSKAVVAVAKKKHKLSAEGRARIIAAQKARWAKAKK